MDTQKLAQYGIDWERGLKNCIGNETFYRKILAMFLEDRCFSLAEEAYGKKDQHELFSRMHELKGISGNAALTGLYEASLPLVELMRKPEADWAAAEPLFIAAREKYALTCEGIEEILAQ